jgi:hypothetical protein
VSNNSWRQTIVTLQAAGPTLTAAAAASQLNGQAKFTFPANLLKIGDSLTVRARGIISCVVTTPGTATYDLRFGSTVVYSTGAINLDVVAKTNVPWSLDVNLLVRSIGSGTAATAWGQGVFSSEAVVGSPLNSVGGNGLLNVPVGSLAVSTGFDSTVSFAIDSFFTQTVATGSMTCEMFDISYDT